MFMVLTKFFREPIFHCSACGPTVGHRRFAGIWMPWGRSTDVSVVMGGVLVWTEGGRKGGNVREQRREKGSGFVNGRLVGFSSQ